MPELSDLVAVLPRQEFLGLLPDAHPALACPELLATFIPPPLRLVSPASHGSSAPFIIVSAPGAVGKTALARQLAASTRSTLWDLSRLKVGDNTFIGTVAQAFGPAQLAGILDKLAKGRVMFVFDAFDEAEILSGWSDIEGFLKDLWNYAKEAAGPCLVLLARSDTAELLRLCLEEHAGGAEPYAVYEIDYFDRERAVRFIGSQLDQRFANDPSPAHRTHEQPFREALQGLFEIICTALSVRVEGAWDEPESRSFVGYAPVLQAIASYLASFTNYQDAPREQGSLGQGEHFISDLIHRLLIREQEKVVKALKAREIPQAAMWDGWNALYTPDEQLERIFSQVNKGSDLAKRQLNLPPWLGQVYIDAVNGFLPQHAFLRQRSYAGPAFRDYTLATLLRRPALAGSIETELQAATYVPTPLFVEFYLSASNEPARGRHAGYLYEAAVAGHGFETVSHVLILRPEDVGNSLGGGSHLLEISNLGRTEVAGGAETRPIPLTVSADEPVVFSRHLRNAHLRVDGTVMLGHEAREFELMDAEISCRTLNLRSSTLIVRCPETAATVISAEKFEQGAALVKLEIKGSGQFRVLWPGAEHHPWTHYRAAVGQTEALDRGSALLAVRKILTWFRRDKKADFARYKLLVDNIAVGNHRPRMQMLRYLLQNRILVESGSMYRLDQDRATGVGIDWMQLRQGRATPEMAGFLDRFLHWVKVSDA